MVETTGNRERYTRLYAFSSMCECAYCGHKLTRRTRHSNCKLDTLVGKKQLLNESINKQKDVEKRMAELRQTLENEEILDEFDRVVFESIIDRILVGGYNEDGSPDPYKLTFVLKGNQSGVVPNAKAQFKVKNSEKGKMVS